MWTHLTEEFRNQISAQAQQAATPDGKSYLTIVLGSDDEQRNPCWRASEWTESTRQVEPGRVHVLYRLPTGKSRVLTFDKHAGQWFVSRISQSLSEDKRP